MSKLIGPVRLVEYKDPERYIYFFGDYHSIEPKCFNDEGKKTEVQDFLEFVLNENKKNTIDFFLEIPSIEEGDIHLGNSYIDKIADKFIDCFKVDKKNCSKKYPNLRAHYVDRRQEPIFENISSLTRIVLDTKRALYSSFKDTGVILSENEKKRILLEPELNAKFKLLKFRKMLYHIYLRNFLSNSKTSINDILTIFTDHTLLLTKIKFYKQLENIEDKKTANFIKEYFENKLSSFQNRTLIIEFLEEFLSQPYNKAKDNDKGTKKVYNKLSYEEILFYLEEILKYNAYYMDAYTIARLFRNYENPKSGREKAEKAKYIMVYAGDAHIDNYLDFFNEYNSKFGVSSETQEAVSNFQEIDYQCIDLAKFSLPFFQK